MFTDGFDSFHFNWCTIIYETTYLCRMSFNFKIKFFDMVQFTVNYKAGFTVVGITG
jgi:hypothetical protein